MIEEVMILVEIWANLFELTFYPWLSLTGLIADSVELDLKGE